MQINKIIQHNVKEGLPLPDKSVNMCVTSPPYWGLRDYGTATWVGGDALCPHTYHVKSPYNEGFNERAGNSPGLKKQESQRQNVLYKDQCKDCGAIREDEQLGLEKTPEEFIANMVKVFMEVHRVLKDDGTLWLNIGDSYAGSWGNYGGQNRGNGTQREITNGSKVHQKSYDELDKWRPPSSSKHDSIKPKDLVGIPWMLAFALRSAGWYLRQDIIWSKPNPMPESVTDRCTKSHEYIFLLSKSQKYYYDQDAILQAASLGTHARLSQDVQSQIGSTRAHAGDKTNGTMKAMSRKMAATGNGRIKNNESFNNAMAIMPEMANKRSVWSVATQPYSEAHFATFPPKLIIDCIKAGCPHDGIVLDPFMGAGTTALVARGLLRNYIGFELNPDYITIANKRLYKELGAFL